MIATPFRYEAPTSIAGAAELAAADPEGTVPLSGGTWVVPDLNSGRYARVVIDLRRAGLDVIEERDGHVFVGATCTYSDLLSSPVIADRAPMLRAVARVITGGQQILNQGTVGGSAAAARPQSDLPAALVSLDATAIVRGPTGPGRIHAADLFVGAMKTALSPGELLVGFEIPATETSHGYYKLKRSESSWPIATAAALVAIDAEGFVAAARLVLGGVSATPLVVPLDQLLGASPAALVEEVGDLAVASVADPWEDELAPGSYRAAVAGPVARRAMAAACAELPAEPVA